MYRSRMRPTTRRRTIGKPTTIMPPPSLLGNTTSIAAAATVLVLLFTTATIQPASAGDLPELSTTDLCSSLPPPSTLLESSSSSSCQIFATWDDFAAYLPTARGHLVLCAGSWLTRPDAGAPPAVIKNNLRLTCSVPGKCRIRGPGRHLTIKTGDKKRVVVDGIHFEGSDFTSVVVVDGASSTHTFCGNTFVNNSRPADSPKGGGALYAGLNTHLVIGRSVFRSNEARVGGAISFAGQSLTIVDSTFQDNTAVERGGAVETNVIGGDAGDGELLIITGQSSSEDGGANDGGDDDASTKATVVGGTTTTTNTPNGPQRIEIGTSTFIDNASTDDGGASGAILVASGEEWVDLGGNLLVGGTDNGCNGAYARSVSIGANPHDNNGANNDDVNCLHFVGAGGEDIVLDPDQDSHDYGDGNAPETYEEEVAQALEEAAAEHEELHGEEGGEESANDDDCVPCTNLPTAHMITTGIACNSYTYAYEQRCGTEFGWWGRDGNPQHCQYSCWQNGVAYASQGGRPCCDRDDGDDEVAGDNAGNAVDAPPLVLGKGLYKHKETDLHVAEGLTVRRFAKMFEPVSYTSANRRNLQESASDKCTFPVNPDGAATFYDPRHNVDGGFTYCINSESKFSGGVYCVEFDADCQPMDFSKAIGGRADDGCAEPTGGFIPNRWNCNGGTTPWNTWVTCEELDVEEDGGGYCWQVDPYSERAPERISAIGLGEWEAMAVDDRTSLPIFFFTEDWSEGALRRFEPAPSNLPAGWHTLHGDGDLSFLVFDDVNYEGSDITGTFYWSDNLKEGRKSQSQYFPNLEGIAFMEVDGLPLLFFVSKTRRRLYKLNLDTFTWSSTTTQQKQLPDGGSFWNGPDMLVPVGEHFIFHTEDGGGTPGVFFKDLRTGQYLTIFQDEIEPDKDGKYGEETTGLAISPNGQCLLSCLQDRGECFVFEREDGGTFESLAPRLRVR